MFETERIKLRKLKLDDHTTYHVWRNDLDVTKSTSPALDIYTETETEDFIAMISSNSSAKSYIIESKETLKAIGITSLINLDYKNRSAECIIDIGDKTMWNKGIASESLGLLIYYAFNELNLHRLYLQVFDFNKGAIHVYEKLGFTEEGRAKEALFRNGQYHDIVSMSLLREEYLKSTV